MNHWNSSSTLWLVSWLIQLNMTCCVGHSTGWLISVLITCRCSFNPLLLIIHCLDGNRWQSSMLGIYKFCFDRNLESWAMSSCLYNALWWWPCKGILFVYHILMVGFLHHLKFFCFQFDFYTLYCSFHLSKSNVCYSSEIVSFPIWLPTPSI